MKYFLTLCTLLFLAATFELQAQTTTEPSTSTEQKVAPAPGCHGGAMKPGCCKSGEQAKANCESHGKKAKKGKKSCCAEAGNANCCANKSNHAGQACHPGCTMPCCAPKKEEKSAQ